MLKYFTNALEGNASKSLAINPAHVVTVYENNLEFRDSNGSINKSNAVTCIFTVNNVTYNVTDTYLEVVARFNERD